MSAYRDFPRRVEPAPREVPRRLVWQLRLGGTIGALGWVFLALGCAMVWAFVAFIDLTWVRGPVRRVPGEAVAVSQTSVRINRRTVHEVRFRFVLDGQERSGTSYSRERIPAVGAPLTIELPTEMPEAAVVAGMSRGVVPVWVLPFVGVFALIGGVFVLVTLGQARRHLRLLRHGVPTLGKLVERRPTNARINNRTVYALTFELTGELDRKHRATIRTHEVDRLVDDTEEVLLHDPRDPRQALPLDHLPGAPKLDAEGRLHAEIGDAAAKRVWILPGIVVVVNVVGALVALA